MCLWRWSIAMTDTSAGASILLVLPQNDACSSLRRTEQVALDRSVSFPPPEVCSLGVACGPERVAGRVGAQDFQSQGAPESPILCGVLGPRVAPSVNAPIGAIEFPSAVGSLTARDCFLPQAPVLPDNGANFPAVALCFRDGRGSFPSFTVVAPRLAPTMARLPAIDTSFCTSMRSVVSDAQITTSIGKQSVVEP